MALLDFFLSRKKEHGQHCERAPANYRRGGRRGDAEPHYLPQLRKDILEVILQVCANRPGNGQRTAGAEGR